MYNAHRGMMPQHQVPPNARLTELLEQIRAEFDNQARSLGSGEQERDHFIHQQMQEMSEVRRKIYELEQSHQSVKEQYERKIADLQREIDMRGPSAHHNPQHSGPPQPPPPSIGHGPKDLFGQIMAGSQGAGQPQLGPPPQEPQQPQGLPAHLTQGAGLNTGPQPQQHGPYAGYSQPGPTLNGYQPQGSQQPQSPGASKRTGARGQPGGAATPQGHQPYPQSPRGHIPTPPPGGSHRQQGSLPPPSSIQAPPHQPQPPMNPNIPNVGNSLSDLAVEDLPNHLKKVGEKPHDDWWAIFNPRVQRVLDVDLVQTLPHQSVVCCVRFSQDGRFIATGCNRTAQIYDVSNGTLVAQLEDETPDRDSDLYIRSVCFSPDGKYLATGAEDQVIRVWDIQAGEIKASFYGHEQDIYSLDFSRNGRHIASGSGDKTVRIWDLETNKCNLNLQIEDGVTTVALSADGRLVAAGSLDRSVRVWDAETGQRLELLDGQEGHGDSVYSVAFSPSDRELVSGSLDRTIKMWSLGPAPPRNGAGGTPKTGQGKCVRTFEGHADFVLSVALTPDGHWVLSGSKDRGVQFWNPRTGEAQLHLQGHRNSVISVAPSPVGGLFATGSGDQKARIWSYKHYQG